MVGSTYLPPDSKECLLAYVYRADDRSYLYKYLWRPLCRWLVERLPVWLAPNTITVTALAIVCATHALLAYYMPKMTVQNYDFLARNETGARTATIPFAKEFLPPPPPFVFVLAAAGLFLYQLLDNLDGHQARRTGTSSPLGLLMDHGCDAFNCVVGSLSVVAAVSAGPCWKTWLVVINTLVVFFMNTWEEYYRGILVLPVLNGPNEGIVIAILVYLWTAYKGGPNWWGDNAITIPEGWLPLVLRQPAPEAAVAVERIILGKLCPILTRSGGSRDLAPIPFFFNLNCSDTYRLNPPLPTAVSFHDDPATARREQVVMGKLWEGQSVLQRGVLRAYGSTADNNALRVRYNSLVILAVVAMSIATCVGNVYQVWCATRHEERERRRRQEAEEEAEKKNGKNKTATAVVAAAAPPSPDKQQQPYHRHSSSSSQNILARNDPAPWFRDRYPFLHACTDLIPLAVLTVMANAWFLTSQEDIFRRHPRIFCWTVSLVYTKAVIHLMVSHLCGCEFSPFRRTFVPFVLFGAHITMTYFHNLNKVRRRLSSSSSLAMSNNTLGTITASSGGGDGTMATTAISEMLLATSSAYSDYAYDLDEELVLFEFFVLALVTFAHLVWTLVRETAAVLEVPIFTVPRDKQRALARRIAAEKAAAAKAKKKEIKKIK